MSLLVSVNHICTVSVKEVRNVVWSQEAVRNMFLTLWTSEVTSCWTLDDNKASVGSQHTHVRPTAGTDSARLGYFHGLFIWMGDRLGGWIRTRTPAVSHLQPWKGEKNTSRCLCPQTAYWRNKSSACVTRLGKDVDAEVCGVSIKILCSLNIYSV